MYFFFNKFVDDITVDGQVSYYIPEHISYYDKLILLCS